ncbi:MAG TPA: YigZ family protein [Clostridiales bacterium]|nr:YigZ family protein [Clostridiales bacterium]
MGEYRTIKQPARAEFIEKRSRFIGTITPVSTEEAALDFIKQIKQEFWDATHNVYAYVLKEGQIRRYSDDGEPKGTAGVPVLDVLLKEELVNCAVVVTRYFGGIMLGAGGLVRAYSHGAKIAVDAAQVVTMKPCYLCKIICEYSQYDMLNNMIQKHGCTVENVEFTDKVSVYYLISKDIIGKFDKQLNENFFGTLKATILSENFAAF